MEIEEQREEQLEYYIQNRDEFAGEAAHHRLVEALRPCIPTLSKQSLAIDIGANVGNELAILDRLCREPGRKILAFEPNPLNLPLLTQNAMAIPNVEVFPFAVSDSDGELPFFTYQTDENEPGYLLGGLRAGGKIIATVPVKSLDSILVDYPEETWGIKYVKIDTEGNDTLVIRGMKNNLHRIHYILFEASDCLKDSRGPGEPAPLQSCVEFLEAAGFDVYRIGTQRLLKLSGGLWHPAYENLLLWSNCFALKKGDTILDSFLTEDGYYKS